jgi:hypothetical protein
MNHPEMALKVAAALRPHAGPRLADGSRVRAVVGTMAILLISWTPGAHTQEKITYTDHVLPLVEQHCAKCHNPDKKKGDLDLTSYSGALKGGGSGVVVVSGNPDSSKIIKALTHAEEPNMPPNKPPLPEKELAVFRKWIAGGLLETSGSKAIAAKPSVDLTLKLSDAGKPDGPPPMPKELPIEPVVHTVRGYAINGLAASPWAPLVAVAGQKQILLYNTTNLSLLGILPFSEGQPWDLKFSRSGKLLVAGGGHGAKSGKVIVWNIETGERVTALGNEYDTVLAADISPDQAHVALGGPDRLVKILSTRTGELEHKLKKHTDWVTALAFSPNGEMLATADRNGGVTVWDADSGQELFTTPGHKGAVTAISWRTDSKVIATSSEDGTVKLWEASEGKQARTWNAHPGGALDVAYSRDGRLVSCGRDGSVVTWTAEGNKIKACEFFGETALRCAFTDEGTRVVATDFAGRVAIWEAKTGHRLGELDANPLPLAEQIIAAQKRLLDLQSRGDQPSPALTAAEAGCIKLNDELEVARAESTQAKSDFEGKAKEVVRLKELATRPGPPADLDQQLAAARAAREKARAANTNAVNLLETRTKQAAAAKSELELLRKSSDPKAELAAAQAGLQRLIAARTQATLFKTREMVGARKREAAALESALKEKQDETARLTREIAAAKESASKAKLKTALKSAQADAKSLVTQLKKAEADAASEQARLEKLARDFEAQKRATKTDRADAGSQ